MEQPRDTESDDNLFDRPWLLDLLGALAALVLAGLWACAGLGWGWGGVEIVCGVIAILLGFIGLFVIGSGPFGRLNLSARLAIQLGFAMNTLGLLFFAVLSILS